MGVLKNPKHEMVAQELAAMRSAEEASATADYDTAASSFAPNARKRAQRKDIRARVIEIQSAAAERAGITAEYLLGKLDDYIQYNLDDYLTKRDKKGQRFVDISNVPRALLGRLAKVRQHISQRSVSTTIEGYNAIEAIRLMAQIKGCMAPTRSELTGADGGPIKHHDMSAFSDEQLAQLETILGSVAPAGAGTGRDQAAGGEAER